MRKPPGIIGISPESRMNRRSTGTTLEMPVFIGLQADARDRLKRRKEL